MPHNVRLALGLLTGLVGLLGMARLIADSGLTSGFAWAFVLVAMLPWVAYCGWRARHGRLGWRAAAIVLVLCGAGSIMIWLFTLGPVLALACSLAAFVVIWVHDWPPRREPGEETYVHIEELTAEEPRAAA